MRQHRDAVGELGGAVDHFLKVTRSYWPGLFACYDTADRPRTNNDLERAFGSYRYHKRRATGRKGASPALVLRGSARLVAGLATRTREVTAADLEPEVTVSVDGVYWHPLACEDDLLVTRRLFPFRDAMTRVHELFHAVLADGAILRRFK